MKLDPVLSFPVFRRWRMALVLAGAAGLLCAQGGPPPEGGGHLGGGDGLGPMSPEHLSERLREPRVSEALKLSDSQLKRLDQIGYDAEKRMIDLHGDLQRTQLDMKQALQSDAFDAAAVRALAEKWSAMHAKVLLARFESVIEIRKVLTAEQWHTLRSLGRERMLERRQELRGRTRGASRHEGPRRYPSPMRRDGHQPPPPSGDAPPQD